MNTLETNKPTTLGDFLATTPDNLRTLADHAIKAYYPHIAYDKSYNPYVRFFRQVMLAQVELVAQWQCVGFIHGDLALEHISIAGETIGTHNHAFMAAYDPGAFSPHDTQQHYAYNKQPAIMQQNLSQFAQALLPLFDTDQATTTAIAKQELDMFMPTYSDAYMAGMRNKLGFMAPKMTDSAMVKGLLALMHAHKLDYTHTLASLAMGTGTGELFDLPQAQDWIASWQERLDSQVSESLSKQDIYDHMTRHNPKTPSLA